MFGHAAEVQDLFVIGSRERLAASLLQGDGLKQAALGLGLAEAPDEEPK